MAGDQPQIDTSIRIVTPENISFQYQLAGPFRRLPAFLIDFSIRMAVVMAIGFLVQIFSLVSAGVALSMFSVLLFGLEWFYGGLFETFMNGQTPGKWLMGLRVLRVDGQPINGMQAVMRNVLRSADLLSFGFAGLICCAGTQRYQRLGDVVCGTIVVVEEKGWLWGMAKLDDERAVALAGYLPANVEISRSLGKALATYVERRLFFSPPRRREIARHLGEPLLDRFELPRDTSHDLLLCALYYRTFIADRRDDERWQKEVRARTNPASAVSDSSRPPPPPPLAQEQMVTPITEPPRIRI